MLSTVHQQLRGTYAWSDSATYLFAISPPLACRNVYLLFVQQILVRNAPTGTNSAGRGATFTSKRHLSVTFENRSQKRSFGLETAKRTLLVTMQQGVRTAVHPLHRQYWVDHLYLNRGRLNGVCLTYTLCSKVTFIQGNPCAQIFTTAISPQPVHPLNSKARVAQALTEFTHDVGIPDTLLSDGAAEVTGQHTDLLHD